jgi:tetratricopeptide (TPR) repeat protein
MKTILSTIFSTLREIIENEEKINELYTKLNTLINKIKKTEEKENFETIINGEKDFDEELDKETSIIIQYLSKSIHHYLNQNYKVAIESIKKLIILNTNKKNISSISYYMLGEYTLEIENNVQLSLQYFNNSIENNEYFLHPLEKRSIIYMMYFKEYNQSLKDVTALISMNPKIAKFYFSRGYLLENKMNKIKDGLEDYSIAIKLDKKFSQCYYYRGLLFQNKMKNIKKAKKDFSIAIKLDPKNSLSTLINNC